MTDYLWDCNGSARVFVYVDGIRDNKLFKRPKKAKSWVGDRE